MDLSLEHFITWFLRPSKSGLWGHISTLVIKKSNDQYCKSGHAKIKIVNLENFCAFLKGKKRWGLLLEQSL